MGEIDRSDSILENLKKVLLNDFPEFEMKEMASLEMIADQTQRTTKEKRFKSFIFQNKEIDNSITLEPDAIVFDIKKYKTYKEFKEIVQKVFQNLEGENSSAKVSRIGLRYINQIIVKQGNPFDWTGLIKEPLICSRHFIEDIDGVRRLMGVLEFNTPDYFIRFQYGWFNSEYPNPIARKEFLLDYDCSSTNEINFSSGLISQIDIFHDAIKELFKKSKFDELDKL
ncbi:MAG: TIGR04255 family protein [ANME-2 cluster archaeon]|nr:TIGR04255 family protein [ANME-2 cluster archaeon]